MSKGDVLMVLEIISNAIDGMDDDEVRRLHSGLCSGVGHLIHKIGVINRLKDHYPIGRYAYRAQWYGNVLEINVEGRRRTIVSYNYVDGYYYKESLISINVNGKGSYINKSYKDSKGLTEDELFQDISMIRY